MGPIRARVEAVIPRLRELLRSRGATLAYVFGSVAAGRERDDSDLDVAVLLGAHVPPERFFDVTIDLNTQIIGLTHTNEVDVVILDEAPPLLAYEVVATGTPILGDHDERVDFEVATIKRFHDTEWIRRVQQEALLGRLDALAERIGKGERTW